MRKKTQKGVGVLLQRCGDEDDNGVRERERERGGGGRRERKGSFLAGFVFGGRG